MLLCGKMRVMGEMVWIGILCLVCGLGLIFFPQYANFFGSPNFDAIAPEHKRRRLRLFLRVAGAFQALMGAAFLIAALVD